MRRVYLDNNATTRVDPLVLESMLPWFGERYGNASSQHSFGTETSEALKAARRSVADLLGAASEQEIVFTSGGTESDNAAILSALETQKSRNEVITSAVEHPAILAVCDQIEKARGVRVHRIGVDEQGRLDLDAFERALSERTAVVSIMWANNETGTIFPVQTLAGMAHDAGALFHTDAVQAAGKIPIRLKDGAIDMLSFSGHKLHGPKGIGGLYVRKGVRFAPAIRGGKQERGRRGGTENAPAIVGLGKAAELAADELSSAATRIRKLRDQLEDGLLALVPEARVLGDRENRLPNTLSIAFDGLESDSALLLLDRAGIAASSGSACASGSLDVSHVVRAMNVPWTLAHGVIRFSLSRENTEGDIDAVLASLPAIVEKTRALAPAAVGGGQA